jgi:hypothetical protein
MPPKTDDEVPLSRLLAALANPAVRHFIELLALALQLPFLKISESMGNHDSKIVDADSVD